MWLDYQSRKSKRDNKSTKVKILHAYMDLFWFGLVLWHGNHIKYIISKYILLITFLNEPELIFFFFFFAQLNDFTFF